MDSKEISIEIESASDYGDVVFFDGIFERLGLQESIDRHSEKRAGGFSVGKISRLIVDSYCINLRENKSKLEIPDWYKYQSTLQECLNLLPEEIGDQDLYRCLEYQTEKVQHKVINDYVALLATEYNLNMEILFEDITSTYFTGDNCPIAYNGYSRDHRPDLDQVNIELAITKEGYFPVKHSTYPGNIPDKKRGDQIPGELRRQYPDIKTTLVVDKGISKESNLKAMIKNGFDYVACPEINSQIKDIVLSVEDSELKPEGLEAKGLTAARRKGELVEKPVYNYIYYNPKKATQDAKDRKKRIEKAKKEVEKIQERINKGTLKKELIIEKKVIKALKFHKVNLYYQTKVEMKGKPSPRIILEPKDPVFKEKERLDGRFLLQTTHLDKSPKEVLELYRSKDGVEKAFNIIKNLIKVRPIRHWNEERVRGHIFLCILAYLIVSVAKYVIKKANIETGFKKIHQKLHQVRRVVFKITVGQETYRKETVVDLDDLSRQLLSLVEIAPPT
jgi:transposase